MRKGGGERGEKEGRGGKRRGEGRDREGERGERGGRQQRSGNPLLTLKVNAIFNTKLQKVDKF